MSKIKVRQDTLEVLTLLTANLLLKFLVGVFHNCNLLPFDFLLAERLIRRELPQTHKMF